MPFVGTNRFMEADNGLFLLGNTAAMGWGTLKRLVQDARNAARVMR